MTDTVNDAPMMERYVVTYVVPLEYEVRAGTIALAADEARKILTVLQTKHPAAKLLRIMNDVTYVALEPTPDHHPSPTPFQPPRGAPPSGGSPGTPTINTPEDLNVVAKVA